MARIKLLTARQVVTIDPAFMVMGAISISAWATLAHVLGCFATNGADVRAESQNWAWALLMTAA